MAVYIKYLLLLSFLTISARAYHLHFFENKFDEDGVRIQVPGLLRIPRNYPHFLHPLPKPKPKDGIPVLNEYVIVNNKDSKKKDALEENPGEDDKTGNAVQLDNKKDEKNPKSNDTDPKLGKFSDSYLLIPVLADVSAGEYAGNGNRPVLIPASLGSANQYPNQYQLTPIQNPPNWQSLPRYQPQSNQPNQVWSPQQYWNPQRNLQPIQPAPTPNTGGQAYYILPNPPSYSPPQYPQPQYYPASPYNYPNQPNSNPNLVYLVPAGNLNNYVNPTGNFVPLNGNAPLQGQNIPNGNLYVRYQKKK